MKKSIFFLLFMLVISTLEAQNIQLLYGKGKDKGFLTSTVEMFKPDKLGNTFFFIDFAYGNEGVEGVSSSYWEIARAFTLGKSPFAFHAEYNGGIGRWIDGTFSGSYTINSAWLTGLEYSLNNKNFTKGITFQALYKYIQGKHDASFQLTAVWFWHAFNNKLSFTGFTDFWREDNTFGQSKTSYILMGQPQLWYNLNKHFSAGTEVQVGCNFGGTEGWDVTPSAALKYTF